jgi:ATP-dependent exoDNAse (exonuclease V) beta subunit
MRQLRLFEDPEASSLKNFTIYRSSAGSGKTFTLVKEYLKIVLRNPQDYQHILAITFTNKATEEMKNRVLVYLMEMAAGKHTDMKMAIEDDVRHYPQKLNIQDRAQKALTNILHNYSRFAISTIDHFFSQLVRALARELKLSLNYEIDVDDQTAMEESLQTLYEGLGHNEELRSWIRDFAFSRIEHDKGWQLDYTLIEFGKELFKEKFHQGFSKIEKEEVNIESLRRLESLLQTTERAYTTRMKELASEAKRLIRHHGLSKEDFKGKSTGVAHTFDKILFNRFDLTDTFKQVASGASSWYTANSPKKRQIDEVVEAGLGDVAMELLQHQKSYYQAYVTAKQLQKHLYSYGLLDAISEQLKAYRQSNNLMLLSHNSFLLREVISDQEAPFLFEKLGSYYKHILIDEFQDTSTYQWENLRPLITNSLDHRNHVLLVGDVKQSIYRWRGGDLNLLLHKAVRDLALYRDQLQEKTLLTNRRSAREVVEFNNHFFKIASELLLFTKNLPEDSKMLSLVYQEVEQEYVLDMKGGVCIRFFEKNQNSWRQQALEAATKVIQDHAASGGKLGQCLVLCDRNVEVAEISEYLSLQGIPVDSDQALKLSNYWAVRLLISSMYLLIDQGDVLARTEMAFLYQRGNLKHDPDYHELFTESCQTASCLLENYLPVELVEKWDQLSTQNIYEWVSQLIPMLVESHSADPFIGRFLELCMEQNQKGNTTAKDFLDWWESNKEDQMVIFPSHQDAVRVMTIHKAKGLEAPIVLLPWADFDIKPYKDTLFWTDKLPASYAAYKLLPLSFTSDLMDSQFAISYQQELLEGLTEGLNTVYVAFTSARQRLHVFSRKPSTVNLDDLGNLYKLLWQICNRDEWREAWDISSYTLRLGDLNGVMPQKKDQSIPSVPIDKLRINPYHQKVNIRSGSQRMFTLLDNYHANTIREGIQLHMALERMRSAEDLSKVLDQLHIEGVISEKDQANIKAKINALFNHSVFPLFFEPGWEIFTEREIAHEGIWFKPDRVMVKGDEALVVDYKREKEDAQHHRQLNRYAELLAKMGYREIRKYLVYVADLNIVEV